MTSKVQHSISPATIATTELLILRDGRIFVHNLTATFAEVLSDLNPKDKQISLRAHPNAQSTAPAA